jgi:divergent AAA domain protein
MDAEDIRTLLQIGEQITLEVKKAEQGLPRSIWETYSAFANTIGGTILLGLTETATPGDDTRFEATGISDPAKLKKELFDTLNSDKVSDNILRDADVEIVPYEGVNLMCIQVPQADYRRRPIYINGNPMRGTFKRNYEGDYHCTKDEVKAMMRDSNETGNDGVLMEHYDMNDVDQATLSAYRNRFRTANPDHPWNDCDDKDFLRNMGGYTTDRTTGRESLTLAGLLMFGKGLAVRERFDNIRMDYLDRTNLAPESRWSDRLTYDGMWENNLYHFFTRVLAKLVSNIKRPFMLKGMEREDDTPLHKAIREALTNLIIHADYMTEGILKVEKHDDRFVFSNPGSLKLPLVDIYKGGNSKARNPHIQSMLRMVGFGENIGSGFPTIIAVCKKENWRQPILCERPELKLVELTISMTSLISEECLHKLQTVFGHSYKALSKEEVLVLSTALEEEGGVTNNMVQTLLDKNPIEAGKLLYALVEKKMLLSNNKRRWASYTLNLDYAQNEKSRSKSQGVKSRSKSQGVKSRSDKRQEIEARIIAFCSTPRTLLEIAEELGYAERYRMKRIYIDPLIGTRLQMTSSSSKTDPTQRYVTIPDTPLLPPFPPQHENL